eukprot:6160286-Amphidinium_carterae.1
MTPAKRVLQREQSQKFNTGYCGRIVCCGSRARAICKYFGELLSVSSYVAFNSLWLRMGSMLSNMPCSIEAATIQTVSPLRQPNHRALRFRSKRATRHLATYQVSHVHHDEDH